MDIESQLDIKNYKEFRNYSFKSRYDNGTNSYFKYHTYENLCKINYITNEQFKKLTKEFNSIKKERKNKIFMKQKKLDFIDKYIVDEI
jgi:hypothetical protein